MMPTPGNLTLTTVAISAADLPGLAGFYERLLGWPQVVVEPDWVAIRDPAGGVGINVQSESVYDRPVWPPRSDAQQMMLHLEIRVDDLDAGLAHALECGATLAEFQPQDDVRVCLDPSGHPFCLWIET